MTTATQTTSRIDSSDFTLADMLSQYGGRIPDPGARLTQQEQDILGQRGDLQKQLEPLYIAKGQLGQGETQTLKALDEQIRILRGKLDHLHITDSFDRDTRFQPIDMSFGQLCDWFSWDKYLTDMRQEALAGPNNGLFRTKAEIVLPRVAIMPWDNEECSVRVSGGTRSIPYVSNSLMEQYTNLRGLIEFYKYTQAAQAGRVLEEVKITNSRRGAIPHEVRLRVLEAQPYFDNLILVKTVHRETDPWQIGAHVVEVPPKWDPLIIGRKKCRSSPGGQSPAEEDWRHWLVAHFDATPHEQWIKKHFAGPIRPRDVDSN